MGNTSSVDTPAKRKRLLARKNPYWQGVSGGRGGVSLGYRKPQRGSGCWIAKIVFEGQRVEERIGGADDDGAGAGSLPYRAAVSAALDWSRRQHAALHARNKVGGSKGPTVKSAIEEYVKERKTRSARDGRISEGRLTRHVLANATFASTQLAKMRADTILEWRDGLRIRGVDASRDVESPMKRDAARALTASSLNRLMNDLRAALNAAAEKYRRELPASVPAEIKVGTKAVATADEARKQFLSDDQIRKLVRAAFDLDDDGDFGRLVMLAAATGARHSQLRALRIGDVQAASARLMMPGSRKGRAAKPRPHVAVPVAADVIERLAPAIEGRPADEPLLTRWAYKSVGPLQWERDRRRAWGPAYEVEKPWAATVAKAGVPADTIMYAFRHSSIIRGLRSGLPVRLVAALHDTSSEMIEKHYSAHIVDATEELARRAILTI